MNQIKEDRAKECAHREAVRQQIARDKAEREARWQNEVQERQCSSCLTLTFNYHDWRQWGIGKDWVVSKVEMQWNMSFVQVWISFTYFVKVIKVHVIYNISHYFSYTSLYCIFINCTVHVTGTFCFYSAFLPSFSFVFQMAVC